MSKAGSPLRSGGADAGLFDVVIGMTLVLSEAAASACRRALVISLSSWTVRPCGSLEDFLLRCCLEARAEESTEAEACDDTFRAGDAEERDDEDEDSGVLYIPLGAEEN
jgi:hypothetical protein